MSAIIGVDIGGTKCAVTLGEPSGDGISILEKRGFLTADYPTPEAALEKCGEMIEHLVKGLTLTGIGISCGGPLDTSRGVILSPPNLPGWDEVPVCRFFEERFAAPATLCNDADACAVAEWRYGAGRGTENFIFLTCGTGLGAGLILGGRLYTGRRGMAGEVGHWRMRSYGPVGYGKAGSLEGFCSGGGIALLTETRLLELKQRGKTHQLLTDNREPPPSARDVFRLAGEGDALCLGIVEEVGTVLGQGIARLVDLLNPEMIVGGSIFTRNYDMLYPIVRRVVDREALPPNTADCRILPSELGERIGDFAALAVAVNRM